MNELQNINQLTNEILFYKNQAAQNFLEIGKRLNQVKAIIPHGEWGNYLKDKVSFTQQTANKLMRCAKEFSNYATSHNLPLSKMFELLALPAENREEFTKQNNIKEMTIKKLREQIKKYKKELNEAREVNDSLRSERNEFKEANKDVQKELERTRQNLQTYVNERIEIKKQNEKLAEENEDLKKDIHDVNYMYQSQGEYTNQLKEEIKELKEKLNQVPEGKETIVVQDDPKTLAKIKELEEKLKEEKSLMMYDIKLNGIRQEITKHVKNFCDLMDFVINTKKDMAKTHLEAMEKVLGDSRDFVIAIKENIND